MSDVYASRWSGSGWDPEFVVSTAGAGSDWLPSVAVDDSGHPHVVWSEWWTGGVVYASFDGAAWSEPTVLNDTIHDIVNYDPKICVDTIGNFHVIYEAYVRNRLADTEIFYITGRGLPWARETMVNMDDEWDDNWPNIAATAPDHVWVVWPKHALLDYHTYATRFDGMGWGPEERLDDDSSLHDHACTIALAEDGEPWVFWNGFPLGSHSSEVYWNRRITWREPSGSP
jgi:hypothetical protein